MKHIPEIDGIRAIAVLSVVLYHLGFKWIPGGFVGVDVFFVISGYLITSIIAKELKRGSFSFQAFYARRMLRILPALYVSLFFIAICFSFLFPPLISDGMLDSLYSAIFSYSNILFYYTIDYFGENLTTPTLHFWSLAVEEQFYLLMPLIFWIVWLRGRRRWSIGIFLGIFTLSLVSAGYLVSKSQSAAFYFPWLRAWELMAGSLISFVDYERLGKTLKRLLCEAGMVMVLWAVFYYDDKTLFPGYSALLPVAGTCFMILGAGSAGLGNRLLGLAPMQWTGKISYSLYLVHWPLICLVSLMFALTIKFQIAVLCVSLFLGWFSWRFVETPFRHLTGKTAPHRVFAWTGAATAVFALYFVAMNTAGTHLWRHYPKAIAYSEVKNTDISYFHRDSCFLTANSDGLQYFKMQQCLAGSTTRKNILVIGDSHAANIVEALRKTYPTFNFMQATAVGCKPTLDSRGAGRCTALVNFIYKDWLKNNPGRVDSIVIAGRWEEADIKPLAATLVYLKDLHINTIVYGPSLEFIVPVPLIMAYEEISQVALSPNFIKPDRVTLDHEFRAAFATSTTYFSPLQNMCAAGVCHAADGGRPMFFDRDHMTMLGAEKAVRGMPLAGPPAASNVVAGGGFPTLHPMK
jgi:peptidoglycan/LPS O-acetylase OafA/YrhL